MTPQSLPEVAADTLADFVAQLFTAVGVSPEMAAVVADGLVEADLEGIPSHGVMLVDMYVDRLRQGSVSRNRQGMVVSERNGAVVLDAGHALGQVTGRQAMAIAVDKAKAFAAGMVAVRHGFHFGTAGRYARQAAEAGCIGIAMCNTRPLMPAPGGAARVVGNNPLAIALPTADAVPVVLDMATSEAAMGKIRLAAKAKEPIPDNWAVTQHGTPTTDATEAIAGMLLAVGGPKGFGLAFVIDLICGLLSGGAWGPGVRPLYGDFTTPYDCSHFFMAIDIAHFGDPDAFRAGAAAGAARVRAAPRAPGVARVFTPGEPEWRRREDAGGVVRLDAPVAAMLTRLAHELDVRAPFQLTTRESSNA
jgi:LDH2 family malate/lactate/ureidoglycolate dehydrogenase